MAEKRAGKKTGTKTLLNVIKAILSIFLTVIFYMLVILAVSFLCRKTYDFVYQIFGDVTVQEAPGTDVTFVIEEGDGSLDIAKRLEYSKIIVNRYSFYIRARLSTSGDEGRPILPGTYELNTSMTYSEILAVITDPGGEGNGENNSESSGNSDGSGGSSE